MSRKPQEEGVIKIGLLVPLTGSNVAIGEDIKNAVLLALEDSLSDKVQLIIQDSKCNSAEGVTGFKKLVEIDNVSAVIGIVCSGVAESIGPVANEKGVPTLLAVAASYNAEKEDEWVFKFWPSNTERANFEAKFIIEKLNAKKIAGIYVNNAFGVGLKDEFEKKIEELGGEMVISELYNPKTVDFSTNLTKIKNSKPDVIFVAAYEPSAINILKQARELKIDNQFVTTSAVISESFLSSIGEIGEGLIIDFPITRSELTNGFEIKFANKFNDKIIHPGGYFAYDSIKILTEILKTTQEKKEIKNSLYKINMTGVSGKIEFNNFARNIEKKDFSLFIIKDGQFVPYEE